MNKLKIRLKLLRFCKSTRAAAAVEFAFIGPVYFILILAMVETAVTILLTVAMDFGLQSAARTIQQKLTQGTLAEDSAAIYGQAATILKNQTFGIQSVSLGNAPISGKIVVYNNTSPLMDIIDSKTNNKIFTLLILKCVYKRMLPSKFFSEWMGKKFFEVKASAVQVTTF